MKKLFALLLAAAMVLGLTACGNKTDAPAGDDKTEDLASFIDYVCRHGTVGIDGMEWRDAKVIQ